VRDAVYESTISADGKVESTVSDSGSSDKRLLAYEPEFGKTLTVSGRDGNTLSGNLKTLWDEGNGEILRSKPLRATDAHISIIAHCTPFELAKKLQSEKRTETLDGSFNRYLWCRVSGSKPTLTRDGDFSILDKFISPLQDAITRAKTIGRMRRSEDAEALWCANVTRLRFAGDATPCCDRARPQVLRLSMLYALLDGKATIDLLHLKAALAVWNYCEASAKEVFRGSGESVETSSLAVSVLGIIEGKNGINRSEILRLLPRATKANALTDALCSLQANGLAHPKQLASDGAGRPAERWFAGKGEGENITTKTSLSSSSDADAVAVATGWEGNNSPLMQSVTVASAELFPSFPQAKEGEMTAEAFYAELQAM
jgi:hypothetical protein